MSRSVHTTRRTIINLGKSDFSSAETRKTALSKARREYWKKRRIKALVHQERKLQPVESSGNAADLALRIPIVVEEGKFIHHGASAEDIRAVLAQLPAEALEGIGEIRLCLHRQRPVPPVKEVQKPEDVYNGAENYTMLPGAFSTDILGHYWGAGGVIAIYAFACDPVLYMLPQNICEFYLRLSALKTLVHEVAHHHDCLRRRARGRWRMDREANNECYAEKMEHVWTEEAVLPYLQRAYSEDASDLCKLVAHQGGFSRPLAYFAGDPRLSTREGKRMLRSTSFALGGWAEQLPKCKSLLESRLALAWDFHYEDGYDECLEIVDGLMAEHATDIGVLDCRVDTLIHLARYREALLLSDQLLKLQPENKYAWMHRGDALIGLRRWRQVLVNCARWEQAVKTDSWPLQETHAHRAVAYCAMGNEAMVDACFGAYMDSYQNRDEAFTARRRRWFLERVYREAGKPLPAGAD